MVLILRIFKNLKRRAGPNEISITSKLSFYTLNILVNFILIVSSSPTFIQYLLSIHLHGCIWICTFDLKLYLVPCSLYLVACLSITYVWYFVCHPSLPWLLYKYPTDTHIYPDKIYNPIFILYPFIPSTTKPCQTSHYVYRISLLIIISFHFAIQQI